MSSLVQRRKSIASSNQRSAPATLDGTPRLDMLLLFVELEHARDTDASIQAPI